MSNYTVVRQSSRGFKIDVVSGNGTRHTMLGFETEDEAARWIEDDKRRERLMRSTMSTADLVLDDAD